MRNPHSQNRISPQNFIFPAVLWLVFIGMGGYWYNRTGNRFFLYDLPYIGSSIALGIVLNTLLPPKHAHYGRRFTQLLVGVYMLFFLGIFLPVNMQIEQFFFYVLAGTVGGAIVHYLPAKVIGPILFSRGWCGWGCWTAMALDFLPWKHPQEGRLRGMGIFRYVHFALSLGLVAFLFYAVKYSPGSIPYETILWCFAGNIFYYAAGFILAAFMKDNRAFCKYLCPIPVLQKVSARFSIFKNRIDNEKCTRCGKCERACIMDIKLLDYAARNERILSTECILCSECERACPQNAIRLTAKFDAGFSEFIRFRE